MIYKDSNGKNRKAREYHLFGLTICIYRNVKICFEKRVQVLRDKFFGTGTTMLIFLPF